MPLLEIAVIALSIISLTRIRKLPASTYRLLMLLTVGSIIPLVISAAVWMYLFPQSALAKSVTVGIFYCINALFSIITELEFLKILAPFCWFISPKAIWITQVAFAACSLPYMIAGFREMLFLAELQRSIFLIAAIFTAIVATYNIGQLIFQLYFVLNNLKCATLDFKLRYSMVIIFAVTCLFTGVGLEFKSTDVSPFLMVSYLCTPAFELLTCQAMLLLREAIAHQTHPVNSTTTTCKQQSYMMDQIAPAQFDQANARNYNEA